MKTTNLPYEIENQTKADPYPNKWRPVPPNGKTCSFCGKGHAWFYGFILNNPDARRQIRLVHLRLPGQSRGGWLFNVGDLLRYLDALAEAQNSLNLSRRDEENTNGNKI